MHLPTFPYHPDPVASGSVEPSTQTCEVCNQARGYAYTASFYSEGGRRVLCPWCISNGAAAEKFGGAFSDDHPLREAGLSDAIIREVCERTPGYSSWQQEVWQAHCNDACEFHGDAEPEELRTLDSSALESVLLVNGLKPEHWQKFLPGYEKGGNPAVYKFKCRHCSEEIFTLDFT